METIGQKIKRMRLEKGLTQKDLAALLGTSQQNLAQYEKDKRRPKIETLQKIVEALDVPIGALLTPIVLPCRTHLSSEESKILQAEIEQEQNELDFFNKVDLFQQLLNDSGKIKALEQIELITKIPEYRKDSTAPSPADDLPAAHKSESADPDPEAPQHESGE